MRKLSAALALCAAAALLLTACGDDDSSDAGTAAEPAPSEVGPPPPVDEAIAEQFPVPEPTADAPPGSAAAIAAGRQTCKGKSPEQIRDQFIGAAEANLTEGQLEMVEEIERYEKQVTPNFVAGQLAAGVYEATLPEEKERGGYQGCIYELAQKLQRELKQKSKGQGDNK